MSTTLLMSNFKDYLQSINITFWHIYAQETALTSLHFTINLESSQINQQKLSIYSMIAACCSLYPFLLYSWTLMYMTAVLICLPVHYKQMSPISNFIVIFTTLLCCEHLQTALCMYLVISLWVQLILAIVRRRRGVLAMLTLEVCIVANCITFLVVFRLVRQVYGGVRKRRNLYFAYLTTLVFLLALNEDCHRMKTSHA